MAPKPDLGAQRRGYIFAAIALISCPCHLPILVLLLWGTAAGAFLSEHLVAAAAIVGVVFVLSLVAALRTFHRQLP